MNKFHDVKRQWRTPLRPAVPPMCSVNFASQLAHCLSKSDLSVSYGGGACWLMRYRLRVASAACCPPGRKCILGVCADNPQPTPSPGPYRPHPDRPQHPWWEVVPSTSQSQGATLRATSLLPTSTSQSQERRHVRRPYINITIARSGIYL